jgi:hypothetical protein
VRQVVRDRSGPTAREVAERTEVWREPEEDEREPGVLLVEVERERGGGDRDTLEPQREPDGQETSTFT